jgi:hypothetical protein
MDCQARSQVYSICARGIAKGPIFGEFVRRRDSGANVNDSNIKMPELCMQLRAQEFIPAAAGSRDSGDTDRTSAPASRAHFLAQGSTRAVDAPRGAAAAGAGSPARCAGGLATAAGLSPLSTPAATALRLAPTPGLAAPRGRGTVPAAALGPAPRALLAPRGADTLTLPPRLAAAPARAEGRPSPSLPSSLSSSSSSRSCRSTIPSLPRSSS